MVANRHLLIGADENDRAGRPSSLIFCRICLGVRVGTTPATVWKAADKIFREETSFMTCSVFRC